MTGGAEPRVFAGRRHTCGNGAAETRQRRVCTQASPRLPAFPPGRHGSTGTVTAPRRSRGTPAARTWPGSSEPRSGDAGPAPVSVVVAAWVGSPNLGDELVFAGLRAAGDGPAHPAARGRCRSTRRAPRGHHGVEAVPANRPGAVVGGPAPCQRPRLRRRRHRPGRDELVQPAVPPGPARAGSARSAPDGRRRARRRPARAAPARAALVRCRPATCPWRSRRGTRLRRPCCAGPGSHPSVGADLAWQLDPVDGAAGRPHRRVPATLDGPPGRLPVGARRRAAAAVVRRRAWRPPSTSSPGRPGSAATSSPSAARPTTICTGPWPPGCGTPTTFAAPGWADLAGELATARAVGVDAVPRRASPPPSAAGRSVLLAYSPKVPALGEDLGVPSIPWAELSPERLVAAAEQASTVDVVPARQRLRARWRLRHPGPAAAQRGDAMSASTASTMAADGSGARDVDRRPAQPLGVGEEGVDDRRRRSG